MKGLETLIPYLRHALAKWQDTQVIAHDCPALLKRIAEALDVELADNSATLRLATGSDQQVSHAFREEPQPQHPQHQTPELIRLREALKPFAAVSFPAQWADDHRPVGSVLATPTVGDFRRARAALYPENK